MNSLFTPDSPFTITIEVVPPPDHEPAPLLEKLDAISHLDFHGFSIASNPVAKPRMSAMVFANLLQQRTGKPAILHLTVRDHNRLGLQSELWGARALGIDTTIAMTGDPSSIKDEHPASTVNDVNVFGLIALSCEAGMHTGAVLDFRPEVDGLDAEVRRLEKKVAAGSRFIVTQPVYNEETAVQLAEATHHLKVPVAMGILPLLSPRHAIFLHDKVAGISVPANLRQAMTESDDPLQTGIEQAHEMLELAQNYFSGACIMPPFERFEILVQILPEA